MLKNAEVTVSFSVDDLDKAKEFYVGKLGLEVDESIPSMLALKVPGNSIMIYAKKNHQPATYTVLDFTVDDLDKAIKELRDKGVVFEKYDLPDCKTDEDGIVDYGGMRAAFFNDPSGNNHGLYQMAQA